MRLDERGRKPKRWRAAVCFGLALALSTFVGGAQAAAQTRAVRELVPVGHTVGVKLFADGVLVVGFSERDGDKSPAQESGLKAGDIITTFNDRKIESTEHLQALLQENGEAAVTLGVQRGSRSLELTALPEEGEDDVCRLGAWIRDSMAGIGTVTFYDPHSGVFGALGHGITDVDTSMLMPLESGTIMDSTVKAVKRGESGSPGELRGSFDVCSDRGSLYANTDCGIFGTVADAAYAERWGKPVPLAAPEEVTVGAATILANCEGDSVESYDIEIEKLYSRGESTRNMLIRVTDKRLLAQTGGIVQGMSGSPILQNGKLVGAVTHVLVNDPTRGYGIFIDRMLETAGLNI